MYTLLGTIADLAFNLRIQLQLTTVTTVNDTPVIIDMFGLYEPTAVLLWYLFGYRIIFHMLLGLVYYEIGSRVGTDIIIPSEMRALVSKLVLPAILALTYIVEVFGGVNVIGLMCLLRIVVYRDDAIIRATHVVNTVSEHIAVIPRFRPMLERMEACILGTRALVLWFLDLSYVQPYRTLAGWIELAQWLQVKSIGLHADLDVLTDKLIKDSLLQYGKPGRMVVDVWNGCRKQVHLWVILLRVRIASIILAISGISVVAGVLPALFSRNAPSGGPPPRTTPAVPVFQDAEFDPMAALKELDELKVKKQSGGSVAAPRAAPTSAAGPDSKSAKTTNTPLTADELMIRSVIQQTVKNSRGGKSWDRMSRIERAGLIKHLSETLRSTGMDIGGIDLNRIMA